MKAFNLLAPALNNPRVYPLAGDTDAPRETMMLGFEAAKVILLLAVPTMALSGLVVLSAAIVLPPIPAEINMLPALLGLLCAFVALAVFLLAVLRSSQIEQRRLELGAKLREKELDVYRLRAEAQLAATRPPAVIEVNRPVPVANPNATTWRDESKPEGEQVAPMPAIPKFWKSTKIPEDNLRWFIRLCLAKGFHSRRKILGLPEEERKPPIGPPINDQIDYDLYMDACVEFKVMLDRSESNAGHWIKDDEKVIFPMMGL